MTGKTAGVAASTGRPDGFAWPRVNLDREMVAVVSEGASGGSRLEQVRHMLHAIVARMSAAGTGIVVLTGLPTDEVLARRILMRVTWLLGTPVPQNREGTIIREVRDRGTAIGEGERARYSDSRFGGNLHTDGAELPLPVPALFTLYCIRQATAGGSLQLLHVREIESRLRDRPEVLRTLRQLFHFDRRGDHSPDEPRTTTKPILFPYAGRTAITYLRKYIEIAHSYPDTPPLTVAQVRALDALDELTTQPNLLGEGKQQPGELAIVDNLAVLHGRTTFEDSQSGQGRLLLRTWVNPDRHLPPTAPTAAGPSRAQ